MEKNSPDRYYSLDEEAESSDQSPFRKPRKRYFTVVYSDEETSSDKPKKNRRGDRSAESDDGDETSMEKSKNNRTGSVESDEVIFCEKLKTGGIGKSFQGRSSHVISRDKGRDWLDDGCQEEESSDQSPFLKSRKRYSTVVESEEESSSDKNRRGDRPGESDDDEEISSEKPKKSWIGDHISVESEKVVSRGKLKKNRAGDESGGIGKSFLHSFTGFQGRSRDVKSRDKFRGKRAVNEEEQLYDQPDTYAEPLIRPVWTGNFYVWYHDFIHNRIDGFNACPSSKASKQVYSVAAQFDSVLQFQMLPKSCVWPKSFQGSGPTDDDIGLYFFPSLVKYESLYDFVVLEMVRNDSAMRASVQNSELLIFTSVELPSRFRRYQGKLYLWGVFRGKQAKLHM